MHNVCNHKPTASIELLYILLEGWNLIAIYICPLGVSMSSEAMFFSMSSNPLTQLCVWVRHGESRDRHSICPHDASKEIILFVFRTVSAYEVEDQGQSIPWESLACVVYGLNSGRWSELRICLCFWLVRSDKFSDCCLRWNLPLDNGSHWTDIRVWCEH